jgi:predicted HAD superfamily phosphohydrolase YqeG
MLKGKAMTKIMNAIMREIKTNEVVVFVPQDNREFVLEEVCRILNIDIISEAEKVAPTRILDGLQTFMDRLDSDPICSVSAYLVSTPANDRFCIVMNWYHMS